MVLFVSYSEGVNTVFKYLYCQGNRNGIKRDGKSSTKRSCNPFYPNGMRGKMTKILLLHFFLVPQKDEAFLRHHKEVQNQTLCHFLFQLIILESLGQGGLIKFFLLRFSYLKYGGNHKNCF